MSNELKITCGLIQGDNLSQTFFSLIINGITQVIEHCKIYLYADDVAFYIECDPLNLNDVIDKINEDIQAIDKLIENNGIQLNPSKTQTIIIYHGYGIHGTGSDETRSNVLMNSCVRYVTNLFLNDHISEKYKELGILNAFNRREMLTCCFIYNFIKTRTPAYLKEIFIINKNSTRSGMNTIFLIVKQIKSTNDAHIFGHCMSKLWNSIPIEIRNSVNRDIFHKKIKDYYFKKQCN